MNRREFLKITGVTAALSGAALATNPKPSFALELGKKHDGFPLEITDEFKGFNQKYHTFMRTFWDNEAYDDEYIQKSYDAKTVQETGLGFAVQHEGHVASRHVGKLGFRKIDAALTHAAWSVDQHFATNSEFGIRNAYIQTHPVNPMTGEKVKDMPVLVNSLYSWDNSKVDSMAAHGEEKYKFMDPQEASTHIKKAAKFLGADLVGIAPYNENTKRWTYTEWATPNVRQEPFTLPDGTKEFAPFNPMKLAQGEVETYGVTTMKPDFVRDAGFEPKSVIVLAFEMDYDAFKTAPALVASAAAGMAYSRMAETGHKIADFLRSMGYKAAPCGNDTSISVPLAIEAGLGEGSRMGILVTEKYGPRIRIAKVYTDLELHPDKPVTFGVKEFCDVCMKCADACPGKAISHEPAQVLTEGAVFSSGKVTKSTTLGVEKWFMNPERCMSFWTYNGGDCGTCISVCPYNKIDEWHHDLAKLVTLTPFKPLLRDLDELFGYGGPVEPEERFESKHLKDTVHDFWTKI